MDPQATPDESGSPERITFRHAGPEDVGFLREMLALAATWREPGPNAFNISSNPVIRRYVDGWGREGDVGVLALERDGTCVGGAWYRFFSEDEPGYGFVDEGTPELSIGVRPDRRGQGLGTALMEHLIDAARKRGVERLGLSVEPDNPARALYERLGFRLLRQQGGAWTMVLEVNRQAPAQNPPGEPQDS